MRRWISPVAVLALLTLVVACSRGSDEPRLVGVGSPLDVKAFVVGTLEFSEEGGARIVFDGGAVAIRVLSFEVRGRPGTARVEVASLAAGPEVEFQSFSGDVYQYLEVAAEGFDEADVRSVTLSFAVPNRWLDDDGRDAASVSLVRLANGWQRLATWVTDRAGDETTFQAVSPGLSVFAIVISAPAAVLEPVTVGVPEPVRATPTPTRSPSPTSPASRAPTLTPRTVDGKSATATVAPATATATPTPTPSRTAAVSNLILLDRCPNQLIHVGKTANFIRSRGAGQCFEPICRTRIREGSGKLRAPSAARNGSFTGRK